MTSHIDRRTRRLALARPIALLLGGAALLCWLACGVGPAGYLSDTERPALEQLRKELAAALPLAGKHGNRAVDPFQIKGAWPGYDVVVTGNFSTESAKEFADRARAAHLGTLRPRLHVTVISDATSPGAVIGTFEIDPARDVEVGIRAASQTFPPAATGHPVTLRVSAQWSEKWDIYGISLVGPYTAAEAKALGDAIRQFRKTLPGDPEFRVTISSILPVPAVRLEHFNTKREN